MVTADEGNITCEGCHLHRLRHNGAQVVDVEKEQQGLLEAVNRYATAVGMRINASKTKVMSALIPGEQRQAVLLDGEPLEDVEGFKYLGSQPVRCKAIFLSPLGCITGCAPISPLS